VIHYHGTPVTPRERLYELAGRNFCVSYAEPRDVRVCHEIGQSVMLDNGAFTFWRGGAAPDWDGFMDWAEPWLDYPTTWAVIPDVIDGDEQDNDRLLVRWFARRMPKGAPVWHFHESLERLRRLAHAYERVCFGSSAEYAQIGTDRWHRRVTEAFDVIADERGRVPWVHMLRGLALAGSRYPFASADSTNAARNHAGSHARRPASVTVIAARSDALQCPGRWHPVGLQERILDEMAAL
jgi:hypothetical protein